MAVFVTSRDFRTQQARFFDMADNGEDVIIRRKRKQAYILVPVEDTGVELSAETLKAVEASRQQYKEGNFVSCSTKEEIHALLESL